MNYPQIDVKPLDTDSRYGIKAYKALKQAITEMDIYNHPGEVRLEERLPGRFGLADRTNFRRACLVAASLGFLEPSTGSPVSLAEALATIRRDAATVMVGE